MPKAEPISISIATKIVSVVCTVGDIQARQLGQHARLRIGFRHHRAAGDLRSLPFSSATRASSFSACTAEATSAVSRCTAAEVARGLARYLGAGRRGLPQSLILHGGDVGCDRLSRPVLRDPGQLVLRAFRSARVSL